MSKTRQEPELESLKAFQKLVTQPLMGELRRGCLDSAGGKDFRGKSGMFRRQSHAKAGISPLQRGVPRFSEAEDPLDRFSAWPG